MPIISPTAISPHNRRGINWSSYWTPLTPVFVQPTDATLQRIEHSLGDEMVVYVTGGTDTGKLKYSNDSGATYINEIDMTAVFAVHLIRITKNGNIILTDGKLNIYYSDDKLQTITACSVLDANGDPYVYHTPADEDYPGGYWEMSQNWVDDDDVIVYGNYANSGSGASPVNIYYTIDGGVTWKVFYTFGQNPNFTDDGSALGGVGGTPLGDPANSLICRHIHAINKGYDGNYYVATGESQGAAHFMKCIYNKNTDTWQVADLLSTASTQYERFRSLGVYERNGYLYWGGDGVGTQTVGGIVYKSSGIYKCRTTDINDFTKHELIMDLDDSCYSFLNSGRFVFAGMLAEDFICYSVDYGETFTQYPKDSFHKWAVSQVWHNEKYNYWGENLGRLKIEIRRGVCPNADPFALSAVFTGEGNLLTVSSYATNDAGYSWERSSDGITYVEIGTTEAGVKTFLDSSYIDEANNYYRCRAIKDEYSYYSPVATVENRSLITTWNTENAGSATKTIVIPTAGAGYDFYIKYDDEPDWVHITGTPGNITHEFATTGIKTVKIRGTFPRFYFNGGGDRLKLLTIAQWGSVVWGSSQGQSFYGCANMTGTYTDTPNTSNVTIFNETFRNCAAFNSPVNFNTSNVTQMYRMFYGCTVFNQSVSSFVTSKVTTMKEMFRGCNAFNQSLSSFNTSEVTEMDGMFSGCWAFNQSLSSFNTAKVTTMYRMFYDTKAFDQSLSSFDTGEVNTISEMFRSAIAFNQSIAHFDVAKVTTAAGLFTSAAQYSTVNYDALLIAWAKQTVLADVALGMGTIKYTAAAAASRAVLDDAPNNWVITDGGQV